MLSASAFGTGPKRPLPGTLRPTAQTRLYGSAHRRRDSGAAGSTGPGPLQTPFHRTGGGPAEARSGRRPAHKGVRGTGHRHRQGLRGCSGCGRRQPAPLLQAPGGPRERAFPPGTSAAQFFLQLPAGLLPALQGIGHHCGREHRHHHPGPQQERGRRCHRAAGPGTGKPQVRHHPRHRPQIQF